MKNILAWMCALIGVVFLTTSSSVLVMRKVWEWNRIHLLTSKAWYGKYDNEWGDLTKISLLDGVNKFREPNTYNFIKPPDNGNKNINLYLYGDSYTREVPEYAFANIATYHHGTNTTGLAYTLDTANKNILILETTERFVMGSLHNKELFNVLRKDNGQPIRIFHGGDGRKNYSLVVNKNLEYLLFDYNVINDIRRCKTNLNYSLFNRASGDVAISDNGKYLFFKPTILPSGSFSSYTPISDQTLNDLIASLNDIYNHYKQEGFSEVYMTIIPNPATILQPNGYNNLIPRLKSNPSLKMPCLDVYDTFKKRSDPAILYRVGDTHWNNNGIQIWLNVVNTELRKKSAAYR